MKAFPVIILASAIALGLACAQQELTEDGFRVPAPNAPLEFPRDHGSHPDYKIEWWYLTGQVAAADGRAFGYQATFFRRAAPPLAATDATTEAAAPDNKEFGSGQFFLAHAALTDVGAKQFHHQQRLNRGGWDAHAATETLDVRNGNWSLRMADPATQTMELRLTIGSDIALAVTLVPNKPLVRFGQDGVSRKGAHPQATSYYLTFTRLATRGTLRTAAGSAEITGTSWMDHEIASRQLSGDLAGWDWTAIHLDDGREIKAYILRRSDGTADPFSRLVWIDRATNLTNHTAEQFKWERTRWWQSPTTKTRYPVEVVIQTTDPLTNAPLRLRLRPLLDNQELTGSLSYWEGACEVIDEATGKRVGRAYLELAGYAAGLGKHLR
jgi:predicted secreted hydrolase